MVAILESMIPLILELDEELKDGEQMIDIKTISITGNRFGYVAVIKNFKSDHPLDIRYGNLKATKLIGEFNDKVI